MFCTAEDTEGVEKDDAKGRQATSKAVAILKFIVPELVGYKVICLSLSVFRVFDCSTTKYVWY